MNLNLSVGKILERIVRYESFFQAVFKWLVKEIKLEIGPFIVLRKTNKALQEVLGTNAGLGQALVA